jgi:mono/diheme cytochrome c family protein
VHTKLVAAVLAVSITNGALGAAPDFDHGRKLHNASCTDCHANMTGGDGTALYTRSPRLVNSRPQLEKRVRYCAAGAKLAWSDKDIADVVHYLDRQFYNFGN